MKKNIGSVGVFISLCLLKLPTHLFNIDDLTIVGYNSDAEIENLSDAETVKMAAKQHCAATSKKNNYKI